MFVNRGKIFSKIPTIEIYLIFKLQVENDQLYRQRNFHPLKNLKNFVSLKFGLKKLILSTFWKFSHDPQKVLVNILLRSFYRMIIIFYICVFHIFPAIISHIKHLSEAITSNPFD